MTSRVIYEDAVTKIIRYGESLPAMAQRLSKEIQDGWTNHEPWYHRYIAPQDGYDGF